MTVLTFCVLSCRGFNYLVKKYDRLSIVVLSVAVVIGFSTILLAIVGTMDLVADINAGVSLGFNDICLA